MRNIDLPQIVLPENKSKVTFLNPNHDNILTIKIDGCVIGDNETWRCDYAVISADQVEIYVEWKGSDIVPALAQIKSSIGLLSADPQKLKKLCFIGVTRVPKPTTTIQQRQS